MSLFFTLFSVSASVVTRQPSYVNSWTFSSSLLGSVDLAFCLVSCILPVFTLSLSFEAVLIRLFIVAWGSFSWLDCVPMSSVKVHQISLFFLFFVVCFTSQSMAME